jgi:hypothetical protein
MPHRVVAHLAAQMEHQIPQVVPDLNKNKQWVDTSSPIWLPRWNARFHTSSSRSE